MHCIQYAFVGDKLVYDTGALTDGEVQRRAHRQGVVERYDRCPECQCWTYGKPCRVMRAKEVAKGAEH